MSRRPHPTRAIQVWADIDVGIADLVAELNTIPGVRTHISCQGTIGQGGPHPYRAYVMCSWTREGLKELLARYIVRPQGDGAYTPGFMTKIKAGWGYVHPRSTEGQPDGVQTDQK